jgi:hypothetical protein
VTKLTLDKPKVHHLPAWGGLEDPKRMEIIRRIAMQRGRDPRIATQAVKILKQYKVQPRQYKKQAAAILKWVQNPKNMYYVNEPGERLQDPLYSLKVGYGDCDDLVILLLALYESIRLPTKLVISGLNKSTGQKVRHIEGQHYPKNVRWTHIYGMVGDHPFKTKKWYFFEPTMPMPLGWDVISGDSSMIPEMNPDSYGGSYGLPPERHLMKVHPWTIRLAAASSALRKSIAKGNRVGIVRGIEDASFWSGRIICDGIGAQSQALKHQNQYKAAAAALVSAQKAVLEGKKALSPDYYSGLYSQGMYGDPYQGMASSMIGASIGGAMAEGEAGDKGKLLDWHRILPAVVIGAATSLLTSLLLDWMRGTGTFQGRGTITERIDKVKADDPIPMSYTRKA